MEHIKRTLATDEANEVVLERCDCGQYALSLGPVTVQLDAEVVRALARVLRETIDADEDDDALELPAGSDVQ